MTTWISWATAAPGVMVEVADDVEAIRWQATVGAPPASQNERAPVSSRPPPAARPPQATTDSQRRS